MRSRAGSQILSKANFSRVLNMTGGINGWQGLQASGDEEMGLEYFLDADFSSAAQMAFTMELALKDFYLRLAERSENDENTKLLNRLASFEDGHMAKLNKLYPELSGPAIVTQPAPAEGGIDAKAFLEHYGDQLTDIESILQASMMFEAQAYDMYSRLAGKENEGELKDFYLHMAGEEQKHLTFLAEELNRRLA